MLGIIVPLKNFITLPIDFILSSEIFLNLTAQDNNEFKSEQLEKNLLGDYVVPTGNIKGRNIFR